VRRRIGVAAAVCTAGSRRATQCYGNSNRIVYDFPANDGQRRREEVTISRARQPRSEYHTVSFTLTQRGDSTCAADVTYRIAYTLRRYGSL
jgi:hypothetical protein